MYADTEEEINAQKKAARVAKRSKRGGEPLGNAGTNEAIAFLT